MDKYDFPYRPDMRPGAIRLVREALPPRPVCHRRSTWLVALVAAVGLVPAVVGIATSEFKVAARASGPNRPIHSEPKRMAASGCDYPIETELMRIQDTMDEKLRSESGLRSK